MAPPGNDYILVFYQADQGEWLHVLGMKGESDVVNAFPYEITDFTDFEELTGDPLPIRITGTFTTLTNTILLTGAESMIELKAEFKTENNLDNFGFDNLKVQAL